MRQIYTNALVLLCATGGGYINPRQTVIEFIVKRLITLGGKNV